MTVQIKDIDFDLLKSFLKPRALDSNKGDFGHSLLVGGNYGFVGAIMMSSMAAARVGSGLTTVATRAANVLSIVARQPELMAVGIDKAIDLSLSLSKANVIGIGPGLGQDEWGQVLFTTVLQQNKPLVVDADALNLLAKAPQFCQHWILTPHPGEAARLLGVELQEITSQREHAVKQLQAKYGGIVILKGHHTLVAETQSLYRCAAGNPGMASGGMGDVLTGVITGLLAQKIPAAQAAQIGVYIHAKAADMAAAAGERGLLATDLLPYLRKLVNPK